MAIDWKKVQSLGWLFWPNESKLNHVIIGNIVFIIHAEIAGITKRLWVLGKQRSKGFLEVHRVLPRSFLCATYIDFIVFRANSPLRLTIRSKSGCLQLAYFFSKGHLWFFCVPPITRALGGWWCLICVGLIDIGLLLFKWSSSIFQGSHNNL